MMMPHSSEAFQQMLGYCRSYYRGNVYQLAQIDEFERTYQSSEAFYWYTRPTFTYRLVNHALRTENMIALYTFRYFISDLCRSLEGNHPTQICSTRLYRGTIMNREEIEKYRVGNLVSTNGFLSSSRQLSVAQSFIAWDIQTQTTPSRSQLDSQQYVLFEIDVEPPLVDDTVLADISRYSAIPDEYEVLFNLGTTFEITSINYEAEHYLWHLQMRLSADTLLLSRNYERYIHERASETNVDILYGILLADMGEYNQSFNYFERLLDTLSEDHEQRANAIYSLARAHRFLGEHEKALTFFRRAQSIQEKKLPSSSFDLARTLAGIASTYYEMQNYQQELLHYDASLQMYRTVLPETHIEIARSLNRLGFACINQRLFAKALDYLNQSVTIYQNTVHETHPGIAQPLHNLGLVQEALGFPDQALDFFLKALKIRERALPSGHLQMAESCYCLSLLYEKQGQYDLAFELAQRALKIREKKTIDNNQMIQQIKAATERMKRLSTSSNDDCDSIANNPRS